MVIIPTAHISIADENERSAKRLAICEKCPLFTNDPVRGYICDSSKYLEKGGTISMIPTKGSVSGCGCRLKAKTRIISESCVLGKW